MNCPMIQPKLEVERGEEFVRMGKCTEAECAWWEIADGRCAVLDLIYQLDKINVNIEELLDKIPRGG